MKRFTLELLIVLIGVVHIFAQTPQSFKYQAVARDSIGNIIVNQLISIRIGIVNDSINGSTIYSENHSDTTNQFGVITLEIGRGAVGFGSFENINWGTTSHFLKVEFDESGGTNYQDMGTSQLLSVPYCLNAGSLTLISPNGTSFEIVVDDDGNVIGNCFPMPTISNAGVDQLNAISPTTLEANIPESGTGYWTIISGNEGNLSDVHNPSSLFFGTPDSTYTLRWTILTVCDSSYNEIDIHFSVNSPPPCPGIPIVTDIDGNVYHTIYIDTQCWMKENLKTTTYQNGTPIPNISDNTEWSNLTTGAYAWYDNDSLWKDKYGAMYNHYAVTDPNGLCPSGWHVPSDGEWQDLTDFLGGFSAPHGNELKSCRQVNSPYGGDCNTVIHPRWDYHSDGSGTDDYGFSVLPGGMRQWNGVYYIYWYSWSIVVFNTGLYKFSNLVQFSL